MFCYSPRRRPQAGEGNKKAGAEKSPGDRLLQRGRPLSQLLPHDQSKTSLRFALIHTAFFFFFTGTGFHSIPVILSSRDSRPSFPGSDHHQQICPEHQQQENDAAGGFPVPARQPVAAQPQTRQHGDSPKDLQHTEQTSLPVKAAELYADTLTI